MKVERKHFDLTKVKLIKGGGLECNYGVEEAIESEIFNEGYNVKSTKDIHPDLKSAIDALKPIIAGVYHFTDIRVILMAPEFKANKKQAEFAEKAYQELISKIEVVGLSISGSGAGKGIVVTAHFKSDMNVNMAINTHRIKFNGTKYGFEEDLEPQVDAIVDEVFKYLFEGKRAQLELFSAEGMEEDEDEEVIGKDAAAGES